MPPEVPHHRSLTTPLVKFSSPSSPESQNSHNHNHLVKSRKGSKNMPVPGRRIIPLLVIILSGISVLRLLRIFIGTTSPSTTTFPSPDLSITNTLHKPLHNLTTGITKKEFKLLSRVVKRKVPCNILVFGLERQYLKLLKINSGGNTDFIEDDPDKISTIGAKVNKTQIYKVEYNLPAKSAYDLLKHSRQNPACKPTSGSSHQNSTCKMLLKKLPSQIYEMEWDVIIVDGPSGHSLEAPGRMSVIYTAGVMARTGKGATDVVVHDVDRTIEKWFSWEYLCEENLVSSKGKLWNFRIRGEPNSTTFCSYKQEGVDKHWDLR